LFELTDSNRKHLRQWLPWVDRTRAVADTRKFAEAAQSDFAHHVSWHSTIWFQGRLAGTVGFHSFDWANRSTSMGYWLAEALQGRGIVTRSCRALLHRAFQDLRLHRVEIRCAEENLRSRAVPERLGFQTDGLLRDAQLLNGRFVNLVVYSRLAGKEQARSS
jgi:ribosomal-protein-serine acetyltransferase